jgi:lambda repressor-like predicted transcriptional regulator
MANLSPLKRILQAEGRRQTWLAAQVGIDPADLNRIVNRGLIPNEKTRLAIAAALVRDPSELWPELHEKAVAV